MSRASKIEGLTSRTDSHGRERHRILIRKPGAPAVDRMLPPGTSKTDARQALERVKRELAAGEYRRVRRVRSDSAAAATTTGNVSTLRQAWDAFLETVAGTGWHVDLRSIAKVWCETIGPTTPAHKIDAAMVERFIKARRGTVAPATINRAVAAFKRMANTAAARKWPWMTKGTAADIGAVPFEQEPTQRVRALSDDERTKLEAALAGDERSHVRRVYQIASETGLRLGEILALRGVDVNLATGHIYVERTIARKSKAGTFRTPKGGKRRKVAMGVHLVEELRAVALAAGDGPLCPSVAGQWYTVENFSHVFGAAVKRAKVEGFHFHDVRHDWATRALRSGVSLAVVSKQLGHGDLSITLKR